MKILHFNLKTLNIYEANNKIDTFVVSFRFVSQNTDSLIKDIFIVNGASCFIVFSYKVYT